MSYRNSPAQKAERRQARFEHRQRVALDESLPCTRILHNAVRPVRTITGSIKTDSSGKAVIRSFWNGNHKHNSRHVH